jgi:hypothetical protein
VHGPFTLPALQAAMLKKALLGLAAPKHQAAVNGAAPREPKPSAERMGQAFCEYVERYPADRLPAAGGAAATVVVTMDLDVGRKRRFHTEAQRIALAVRDRGCTAEGCDYPPGLCHAHHDLVSWGRGGDTSVKNGRLLCPKHHHLAHDPRFQTTRLGTGKLRFTRRT